MILHVAACLWDPNSKSERFSRAYDETWVEKLYRGFKRNLTLPFRFVLFTDRLREFNEPIEQELLVTKPPDYGCLIEPFILNEPMIVCGLDTVLIKNIDHMARYCLSGDKIALPRHPSKPDYGSINPVAFVPAGHRRIYDEWRGENDMEWLRLQDSVSADKLWSGQILSLKLHDVRNNGLRAARIVYFHGSFKPHELGHLAWVREHWR